MKYGIPTDDELLAAAQRNVDISDTDRITILEAKVEEMYQALQIVERTLYGVQQMLGKAAEYQGKPRGRLPR